mmetsp:Transcript_44719/g.90341  ORF Transcript_44719/g.90341 Transcript_44719/m.90341 type:complete len:99 (+) Transcript_44719:73-369(+)
MPPRSTGSSTSKIVFMVLGIVAFGAGLFRGFYEPQLPASAIAHTGEATLKGGPHSLTEMETTLAVGLCFLPHTPLIAYLGCKSRTPNLVFYFCRGNSV